ncbi:hypothetical protein [Gordonia rhizosphera]|uniref:Uncharacterized protein n=1 Tax=Gordonia rhizosphera NBRC 16068 TaxID=1108045 RepID=K6UZU9_9ACTN|nr:hypothetical protein [Gordonia rhizosphera]GAB89073.1 hypothetical protein GORHZ_049_00060 [Gordonia rhizosphera NBRC 16068]
MSERLFPDCPLPGCVNPTTRQGQPCPGCLHSFGDYLAHTPGGQPLTAPAQADRDHATRAAYRTQLDITAVERTLAISAGQQAKPGQTCWLCTERRACIRVDGRWECRDCTTIA